MKPAPFKYVACESLEELLSQKRHYGDEAKFLAGGQSLIPTMNFRLASPAVLLDINRVAALDFQRRTDDGSIRLGALTRHATLIENAVIGESQPLVREAALNVAHPQIRNRGTLCGNLAHADPASELPAAMVALRAKLRAQSSSGDRWIEARDFFVAVFTTLLEENEMLTEIEIPLLPARSGTSFIEVARRQGDYAMMGVAAILSVDDNGCCIDARLTYCGAGSTPVLAEDACTSLIGSQLQDSDFNEAAELARNEIEPTGNINASADFQRHLAAVLTGRSLRSARKRIPEQIGS